MKKIQFFWSRIKFKSKPWIFAIVSIVISVVVYMFYFIFFSTVPSIDQDLLCWFFSTVAQSFLALVAFLGMFTVFKLQNYHNNFNILLETNRRNVAYFEGADVEYFTYDEIIEKCRKIAKNNSPGQKSHFNKIKSLLARTDEILENENNLKKDIHSFFYLTLGLIILSIISIPLATVLIEHNFGTISIFLILCIMFLSLNSSIHLIDSLLK